MPTRRLVETYRQDLAVFPDLWHKVGLLLGVVVMLAYPFVVSDAWMTIGNLTLIAIVGSVSLMILTGFAGQISLGHAAFMALGAYTMAIVGAKTQLPFWFILPLGGVICAVVGVAVGAFALRLKGLYLAIVTIGLLYLVKHFLLSFDGITGGNSGTAVPMHVWFGESAADAAGIYDTMAYGPVILRYEQKLYFIFAILAVSVAWLGKCLHRSNAGRAMMAVRDHDIAAAAMGVNPARAKILAFALSSFFAGIAGGMYGLQQQQISVDPFHLNMSVEFIAMIVLGGVGSIYGAVAGAIVFTMLHPLAEKLGSALPLVDRLSSAQQSILLFSIVVLVVLIAEPLGLLGVWLRIKRYFATWPFRY